MEIGIVEDNKGKELITLLGKTYYGTVEDDRPILNNTCEWKRRTSNWNMPIEKRKYLINNPHNDKKFVDVSDYKFCPYCGKRLLVN